MRLIDNSLWIIVLGAGVGMLAGLFVDPSSRLWSPLGLNMLSWLLLLPLAMVLHAVCFSLVGNTPGKAIAGIKVRTLRGEKVGLVRYLKRNFSV